MSTAVLDRPTAEMPRPHPKTLRIPELEAEEQSLTELAQWHYVIGSWQQARDALWRRNTIIRPVLVGLRNMVTSPPSALDH
jgi:hypothetical protein